MSPTIVRRISQATLAFAIVGAFTALQAHHLTPSFSFFLFLLFLLVALRYHLRRRHSNHATGRWLYPAVAGYALIIFIFFTKPVVVLIYRVLAELLTTGAAYHADLAALATTAPMYLSAVGAAIIAAINWRQWINYQTDPRWWRSGLAKTRRAMWPNILIPISFIVLTMLAWDWHVAHRNYWMIVVYTTQHGTDILYNSIIPGIRIYGELTSYVLSLLVSPALPVYIAYCISRRRLVIPRFRWWSAPLTRLSPIYRARAFPIYLILFIGLNIVAWDWTESDGEIWWTFYTKQQRASDGWSTRSRTVNVGINPGIIAQGPNTSVALSAFVGLVLPLLLAPGLTRRRLTASAPNQSVQGAPR